MPSDPGSNPSPSNKPRRRPTPSVGGNWIWLLVLCMLALVLVAPTLSSPRQISYSAFLNLLADDNLKSLSQVGDRYEGEVRNINKLPEKLRANIPGGRFSVERLQGND